MTEEKLYLYPIWVRLWHLVNALLCLLLIITGISMQFSNPKMPLIHFSLAVSIHNIAGILLITNYLIFLAGNTFTRNGRFYKLIFPGLFKRLKIQARFYSLGIFKNESAPFPVTSLNKFNPLQLFTYVGVMYILIPILVLTGLAMLYPEIIPLGMFWSSGLHLIDLFHIIVGFLVSLFMVVHIYFCTIGSTPLSNFKSMINGYHEGH
jgi:thiosulfate reductase cytochrome b subunit